MRKGSYLLLQSNVLNHFFSLAIICLLSINATAQTLDWVEKFGASSNDRAFSVTTDATGNVYTTGYFQNMVDFDPGSGTVNLTSNGGFDAFVLKLNAAGGLVWVKQFGGTANDEGKSITIDSAGNVLITGYFQLTVDFDPSASTSNLTSNGSRDIFITKLDAAGNFVWTKKIGGSGVDTPNSITTDETGNVYSTGSFRSTADFDPGTGTFNLSSAGLTDIYVSKLDAAGNFEWANRMGSVSFDNGNSVDLSATGHVYVTGAFQDTVDFDPGSGIVNLTSSGLFDVFICKLDTSGNLLWAKGMGSSDTDNGVSIITDSVGSVYTTGYFDGTVDFDPGAMSFNLTSPNDNDMFVSKLDSAGSFVWAKRIGGTGDNRGFAITTDALGNLYTTGIFENTADFDPGTGSSNLTTVGDYDVFISKLDAAGNFVWANQLGGLDYEAGYDLALDATGNIYTTGFFESSVDFDPSSSSLNLTASGGDDIFLHKMSQCPSSSGIDTVIACNSYTWIDSNTYSATTTGPIFTIPGGAANGCDSLVILDLTINNSANSTDSITACETYTWIDGNTYNASTNTPTLTFAGGAANGCDSLVTLNLTINNSTTAIDSISACDAFTWIDGNTYNASTNTPTFTFAGGAANGCDSLVTLNLTIINSTQGIDSISACDTFTWIDGNTYNASTNIPTFTFNGGAANGCDSIVTLNLTINAVTDLNTSVGGDTIFANNATANSFQWLDCNDNFAPILGETNPLFVATMSGSYAAEIAELGCVDTTACVDITLVGTAENESGPSAHIYPNPTNGEIHLFLNEKALNTELIVRNSLGQVTQIASFNEGDILDLSIQGEPGIYFVEVLNDSEKHIFKVIKK